MLFEDPLLRLQHLVEAAAQSGDRWQGRACVLATISPDNWPEARCVLLRGIEATELRFYTHFSSPKGKALEAHPRAALCFHWPELEYQVRVQGEVHKLSNADSDAYFATRPRQSRLGAWASRQSEVIAEPGDFEKSLQEVMMRFAGKDVPRPPHWGGFGLRPRQIEFWKEGEFRLHERIRYRLCEDNKPWQVECLYP